LLAAVALQDEPESAAPELVELEPACSMAVQTAKSPQPSQGLVLKAHPDHPPARQPDRLRQQAEPKTHRSPRAWMNSLPPAEPPEGCQQAARASRLPQAPVSCDGPRYTLAQRTARTKPPGRKRSPAACRGLKLAPRRAAALPAQVACRQKLPSYAVFGSSDFLFERCSLFSIYLGAMASPLVPCPMTQFY